MTKPVLLQRLGHWPAEEPIMHVVQEGRPEVVDLATIAPWPVLRVGLCQWSTTSSGLSV